MQSLISAVFTDAGTLLIGYVVVTRLPEDLPAIRGFCLQKEVMLHESTTPTACLNLDLIRPTPHSSVGLQYITAQTRAGCHLLSSINHSSE